MCAINGFNFRNREVLLKMNTATTHRGPDGTGIFSNKDVSLGHNRLSIIDPSHLADQPMVSDGGRFVITFNGEIYNYKVLRKELVGNYQFKTNSDTEVILAAYKQWGSECVNKLNGMFAFAIWDTSKKELFFARDHVGIKPFYYFWDGKRFIFSSEIKAILEHDVPRRINKEAFSHYFRILYVPEPLTMFAGIYKLPPAHFGFLRGGSLSLCKYWSISSGKEKSDHNKKELKEIVEEKICSSVKKQLISDKPVGVYLSGGIDSSVILDAVLRTHNSIDTFSVGFDVAKEKGGEKYNMDLSLAKKTAQHYGTRHHEFMVSTDNLPSLFEKVMWHTDDLVSNPTAIPMMMLADFAKKDVDVVLGGDGGDELFGGYERYRLSLAATYYQKLPSFVRKLASASPRAKKLNVLPGIDRFVLFMFQKDNILSRVLSDELVNDKSSHFFNSHYEMDKKKGSFEEAFMDIDRQSWLVDESLNLSDRMSMSAGLEQRVPLLDKELVEFSASIPLRYKLSLFDTKIILKESFRGKIPDFLLNQPKRGWFSPGAKWLRYPHVYSFAKEVLSHGYYPDTAPLFKWEEIRKILESHKNKKEYNLTVLWALISFQIWAKKFQVKI